MQSGQVTEDVVVSVTASAVHKELTDALEKLEDVSQEGDQYRAICPVHGGHGLTIRWNDKSNILVVHCHSSTCKQDDIVAELRKMGVHLGSARHRYEYRDENGVLRWTKVRSRSKDGRRFTYYMCHSHKGSVPIEGVHLGKKNKRPDGTCRLCGSSEHPRGMLYNREAVVSAIAASDEIWLVEGEKDADALTAKGVIATTAMNGVDDWGPIYVDQLAGARTVVIVADNDTHGAGKRGAYNRYLSLTEHVETVCVKVAKTGKDSYDHLQAGYGLKDFVDVPISELEALTQLSNGNTGRDATDPLPGEPLTELGYARRFVARYSTEVRYVPIWNRWLYWDGKRWRTDELQRILLYASLLSRELSHVYSDIAQHAEGDAKKGAERDRAKAESFEGATHIRNVAALASTDPAIACTPKDFDSHPFLLNVQNGVYDLREGTLGAHDPSLMLTRITKYGYDKAATGRHFLRALRTVQPDAARREYLGRIYGCTLEGRVSEQMLAIFHGTGANGKSTFNELVSHVLGNYATEIDPRVVTASGDRHPTEIASLAGRRLVFVEELGALNESKVKLLTSQTPLQARRMREDPWTFVPTHNLIASTNTEPIIRGTDEGIWRRVKLMDWDVQIPREEQDGDLPLKLRAEGDYILTWLLKAYRRYRRQGIVPPSTVARENVEFRDASDPVHAFLAECCIRGANDSESADELYKAFDAWRKEKKHRQMTQTAFGRALTDKGIRRKSGEKSRIYRTGVRLR